MRLTLGQYHPGFVEYTQPEGLGTPGTWHGALFDEPTTDFPALTAAYSPEQIDWEEAARIVGEVLGNKHLGRPALEAHRARGLGIEAHRALTA